MQQIKKIAIQFLAILTLAIFFVSTSGFTLYEHFCQNHKVIVTLTQVDECCEEIQVQDEPSCCEEVSACDIQEDLATDCCDDDHTFYILSDWSVTLDSENRSLSCHNFDILVADIQVVEANDEQIINVDFDSKEKKTERHKYRLFHQAKIAPPLI